MVRSQEDLAVEIKQEDAQDQDVDQSRKASVIEENLLNVHPPNIATFYAILKKYRLRFRVLSQPYECKICQDAPKLEKELSEFLTRKQKEKEEPAHTEAKLDADDTVLFNALIKRKAGLTVHTDQLKTQRQFVKRFEDNLPPKRRGCFEVVVYEDFVSQYSQKPQNYGMKVVSLVLTIKWRGEDGNMRKIFLDFFCTDKSSSADAYFVRQVWRVLLQVNREDKELANVASTEERSVKQQDIEMRLREGKLIDVLRGVTSYCPHFH